MRSLIQLNTEKRIEKAMLAHAGMALAQTLTCPLYGAFRLRIRPADRALGAGFWSIANSYEAYRNLVLEIKK
jgi:hypothetical protein